MNHVLHGGPEVLRDVAMATNFWVSLGYNFGCIIASDTLPHKRGTAPTFSQPPLFDHVYCVQTAGWIKMPLGTEIGLDPGHIVLDGDPAPP